MDFGDGGDMVHEGDLFLVVHEEEARFFLSLEEAMEVLGGLDFVLDDGGVTVALNERFAPRARVEGHDLAPVKGSGRVLVGSEMELLGKGRFRL